MCAIVRRLILRFRTFCLLRPKWGKLATTHGIETCKKPLMLDEIVLSRPTESAPNGGQMKTAFSYLTPLQSTCTIAIITSL